MKKIIFHTGLPKTGTSSIQHFLLANRKKLREIGILFPANPEFLGKRNGQPPHADMFLHFFKTNARLEPSGIDWANIFDEFRADANLHTMIVSFETQSVSTKRLDVEAYRRAISESQAEFITYIREPLSWLNSLYIETLTSLYPFSGDLIEFPAINTYLSNGFRGMLKPFEALGRSKVQSYEDLRKSDSLLSDFLENIGAGSLSPLINKEDRQNTKALRREQALLLRSLKRLNVNPEKFILCRDTMILRNEKQGNPRSNGWVITRDIATMILRQWEKDQPELQDRYGLSYSSSHSIEDLPAGDRFGVPAANRLRQELSSECDEELLEAALERIVQG